MRPSFPANLAKALKRVPKLTASEERQLILGFQSGDSRASERLVLSQLRFVIKVARRYRRDNFALSDLVQEGVVGLLEAIKRFNPDKGVRLSTYAVWWIRASIQNYVLRSVSAVRPVTTPQHRTLFFSSEVWRLNEQSDKAVRAMANRLGTKIEDFRSFLLRIRAPDRSIDTVRESNDAAIKNLTDDRPNPEICLTTKRERIVLIKRLRAAIPHMTKRERHILRRRFLANTRISRNKIGKELGLSKERVRQLEHRALQKLRSSRHILEVAK
jgi:RNA polymerase sigma-32 factor